MADKFVPYHLHLLCKGEMLEPPKDAAHLNEWFARLVHKVRMKLVAGPTSVYINDLGNEGVTGTVTLATSHASMHVWDAESPAKFQFDIYSCTEFTMDEVVAHLNEFKLVKVGCMLIDRNDRMHVIAGREITFG